MAEKNTVEELLENQSEMLATATDLGLEIPEDLTIEFSTVEVGQTVCTSLDGLIRKHMAGVDAQAETEAAQESEPSAKKPKKSASKRPSKKGQSQTTNTTEESEVTATAPKKAAKKAAAKKPASKKSVKKAASKKAATQRARSGKVTIAGIKLDDGQKVAVVDKDAAAEAVKKPTKWAQRLKKVVSHAGKKVGDFSGPKSDIKWAIARGLVRVS